MKFALVYIFGLSVIGALALSLVLGKDSRAKACIKGNVFILNGQFYQCVKVKPEVIK